jgi:cytosolic phospholipase A2
LGVGVSGSCWAINTYLTYGECSIYKTIEHFKARLSKSFTDPAAAFPLFTEKPTNKYLLRGLVERFKQGYTDLRIVDIFGTLVASRILVPVNEIALRDDWLKLSSQRKFVDTGEEPLPIYTAVRHEIPIITQTNNGNDRKGTKNCQFAGNGHRLTDLGSTRNEAVNPNTNDVEGHHRPEEKLRQENWFQWFEFTPYYVGCEELEAWIPTFGLGRKYKNGINVTRSPELSLSIILGYTQYMDSDLNSRIVGSAFCATLSHYYAEIRPFLPTNYTLFHSLDELAKQVRSLGTGNSICREMKT